MTRSENKPMRGIYGFTGTQHGMAPRQLKAVRQLLYHMEKIHLGDCIGADAQTYHEAKRLGVFTIGHPPEDGSRRAFCDYDVEFPPKPYLERNKNIVIAGVNGLIAAPKDFVEPTNKRGQGTWTTVGYARRARRHIWIVRPDGTIVEENNS